MTAIFPSQQMGCIGFNVSAIVTKTLNPIHHISCDQQIVVAIVSYEPYCVPYCSEGIQTH